MALEGERKNHSTPEQNRTHRTVVKIEDDYSLYTVRNAVLGRADLLGMSDRDRDELELIVRELVTNVRNHGGGRGHIEISHDLSDQDLILQLDVFDHGPGFISFNRALEDGYSSTGSLGGGLSSVRRFAEELALVTTSTEGSHLRVRKKFRTVDDPNDNWHFALYSRPVPGEKEIGDQGTLIRSRNSILLVLADGLGHGEEAAKAATLAIETVRTNHRLPLEELVEMIHQRLRKTRGAALSLARLPLESEMIEWLGVGNVVGRTFRHTGDGELSQQVFANYNGTLGVLLGSYHTMKFSYKPGDWLMLSTDGLVRNWQDKIEFAQGMTPHTLGKELIDKAARARDDCSVLVGKAVP